MIKIRKSAAVPAPLQRASAPASPEEISEDVYAHPEVKKRLYSDQRGKCAYCECHLAGDYGHVEHYRPKGAYCPTPDAPPQTPGYYWLAHDWQNLLLSCSRCNTSWKRNHFPLECESQRRMADRDISAERPLIINPCATRPDRHIIFREHVALPRDGSPQGRATIDLLGLNRRRQLMHERRLVWERYLLELRKLRLARAGLEAAATDAEKELFRELRDACELSLRLMRSAAAPYAGMLRHPNLLPGTPTR